MADAEVISGIVINQLIEPGRPCIYNSGFAHVFDMMTTLVLTGSPENALLQAAGAEMAQYHGTTFCIMGPERFCYARFPGFL